MGSEWTGEVPPQPKPDPNRPKKGTEGWFKMKKRHAKQDAKIAKRAAKRKK